MVYFVTLKLVPGEYFWNNYSSTKEFYLHMKKNFKHVADRSFLSEYNNERSHFQCHQSKSISNFFYYKEDKDVSIRRNKHPGHRIPIFTIGLRLYFYMLFFLFHNNSYMRLFYKVFSNIPRVKFFLSMGLFTEGSGFLHKIQQFQFILIPQYYFEKVKY